MATQLDIRPLDINRVFAYDLHVQIVETLIQRLYEAYVKPGDTVIDVGVHYGIHLFPMMDAVGPTGHVHGFEANPARFEAIRERIASRVLKNATLHNVALTNADREMRFFVNRTSSGHSSLMAHKRDPSDEIQEIAVQGRMLDSVLSLDELAFMKIDVERAEAAVLVGAAGTLRRILPVIVFEGNIFKSAEQFEIDPGLVESILSSHTIFDFAGRQVSRENWFGRGWNFIAVPEHASMRVSFALNAAWESVLSQTLDTQ